MNKVCNLEEPSPDYIYHLHSILVHTGTINSGHYFGFQRPTQADNWYKFNDDVVTKIDPDIAFKIAMGGYSSMFNISMDYTPISNSDSSLRQFGDPLPFANILES